MEQVECVVIGAGVVGLAIARELAISGREVIVLEKEPLIGSETSSRNSEVIHAGIYYPTGSLKAKYCVEGKKFLYRYCAEKGVAHANCGKLIVATSVDQNDKLPAIRRKAAETASTISRNGPPNGPSRWSRRCSVRVRSGHPPPVSSTVTG